nr:uncharacterized protein LOC113823006 isoform X2 [Penaeus vannamei]
MVAINYKSLFQSAQRNDNQGSHQSIHGGEASSVAGVGQGRERAVLATFTRSLAHSHAGGSSWRFNSLSRMGYFRSVSRAVKFTVSRLLLKPRSAFRNQCLIILETFALQKMTSWTGRDESQMVQLQENEQDEIGCRIHRTTLLSGQWESCELEVFL